MTLFDQLFFYVIQDFSIFIWTLVNERRVPKGLCFQVSSERGSLTPQVCETVYCEQGTVQRPLFYYWNEKFMISKVLTIFKFCSIVYVLNNI